MDRRNQISLTPGEQDSCLEGTRTIVLNSIDREGYPNSVGIWFCLIDGTIHMTTFRKAQKVVNLKRDPRGTLLAGSGGSYSKLRCLMLRGTTEVIDDTELTLDVLIAVHIKHGGQPNPGLRQLLQQRATMLCVLRFHPVRVSSWDHRKLGGVY